MIRDREIDLFLIAEIEVVAEVENLLTLRPEFLVRVVLRSHGSIVVSDGLLIVSP